MELILNKCGNHVECDLKIVLYFKESELHSLDEKTKQIIFEQEKLDAKFGSMFYLPYTPDEKKYLFVGLGKKEDFDYGQLREIGSKVAQKLKTLKNIQNAKVCFCSFEK